MTIRKRTNEILSLDTSGDWASKTFDIFIVSLIVLNVAAVIVQSVNSIYTRCPDFFYWFEVISIGIFTLEYLLRLWSCVEIGLYQRPFPGRLKYALTPLAMIDLIVVMPFYLPLIGLDLRFLRVMRLLRIFRMFKIARYSKAIQTLGRVFRAKRAELLITLFVLVLLLVVASTLMYYAEHDAQPAVFTNIPATAWWAIATLTTVGYGDVYPITTAGKIIASLIAILGIGMFALPTGILGAGFVEEIKRGRQKICPHCGKNIDENI